MIARTIFVLSLFLALLVNPVQAELLVLVHGYRGDAYSWERSGVVQTLNARGWQRGGVVSSGPFGLQFSSPRKAATGKAVYLVSLPSEAPIPLQASHLTAQLDFLARRHPQEKMYVAGHSAGGVVARLVLVQNGAPQAQALITIASPHLGTARALQGLDASSSSFPFSMFRSFFGGSQYHTLRRSRGLLLDLRPPLPGNFLFWLNGQAHPDIYYHSVIRGQEGDYQGDQLVPGFSQDMNSVATLSGHSQRSFYPVSHALTVGDGVILADILATFR